MIYKTHLSLILHWTQHFCSTNYRNSLVHTWKHMERLTEISGFSKFLTVHKASVVQEAVKKYAKEVLIMPFLCPPAVVWNTSSMALSLSLNQSYYCVIYHWSFLRLQFSDEWGLLVQSVCWYYCHDRCYSRYANTHAYTHKTKQIKWRASPENSSSLKHLFTL